MQTPLEHLNLSSKLYLRNEYNQFWEASLNQDTQEIIIRKGVILEDQTEDPASIKTKKRVESSFEDQKKYLEQKIQKKLEKGYQFYDTDEKKHIIVNNDSDVSIKLPDFKKMINEMFPQDSQPKEEKMIEEKEQTHKRKEQEYLSSNTEKKVKKTDVELAQERDFAGISLAQSEIFQPGFQTLQSGPEKNTFIDSQPINSQPAKPILKNNSQPNGQPINLEPKQEDSPKHSENRRVSFPEAKEFLGQDDQGLHFRGPSSSKSQQINEINIRSNPLFARDSLDYYRTLNKKDVSEKVQEIDKQIDNGFCLYKLLLVGTIIFEICAACTSIFLLPASIFLLPASIFLLPASIFALFLQLLNLSFAWKARTAYESRDLEKMSSCTTYFFIKFLIITALAVILAIFLAIVVLFTSFIMGTFIGAYLPVGSMLTLFVGVTAIVSVLYVVYCYYIYSNTKAIKELLQKRERAMPY